MVNSLDQFYIEKNLLSSTCLKFYTGIKIEIRLESSQSPFEQVPAQHFAPVSGQSLSLEHDSPMQVEPLLHLWWQHDWPSAWTVGVKITSLTETTFSWNAFWIAACLINRAIRVKITSFSGAIYSLKQSESNEQLSRTHLLPNTHLFAQQISLSL